MVATKRRGKLGCDGLARLMGASEHKAAGNVMSEVDLAMLMGASEHKAAGNMMKGFVTFARLMGASEHKVASNEKNVFRNIRWADGCQ